MANRLTLYEQRYLASLFGKPQSDGDRKWAINQYAMGTPITVIAEQLECAPAKVYTMLNSTPEEYEDAKELRDVVMQIRNLRTGNLAEIRQLHQLEKGEITDPRVLSAISERCHKRTLLHENKTTENIGINSFADLVKGAALST